MIEVIVDLIIATLLSIFLGIVLTFATSSSTWTSIRDSKWITEQKKMTKEIMEEMEDVEENSGTKQLSR